MLSSPGKIAPVPRAGFVDLSRWNFARDGAVRLSGEWLFFESRWAGDAGDGRADGVRAKIPGPWPASKRDGKLHAAGFGTYTLTLKLPAAPRGDGFAVDTGQFHSAYRVYADDTLIADSGSPAADAKDERANSYGTLGVIPSASRLVTLKLEVSNHLANFGGVFASPTFGVASVLAQRRHLVEMLQLIVAGALLFAAFYHFAFHGILRSGQAHLWFALTAALMATRNFLFEPLGANLVPLIGQDWVWRVDVAVTSLCLPGAYWFLALSFRRYLSRTVGVVLTISCIAGALVSLIGGAVVGDSVLKAVEIQACAVILYLTQAIVRSAWEGERGASLALLGWLCVSAAVVHDTLVDNQIIAGGNALPVGCVAFFLCLSGALSARSHAAFEKVEKLSAELRSLNTHLETVVGERTVELSQKILELEAQQIALEQSRKAAVAASETKSRFLANMSHELRTPLNAILGFSEIIRGRIFGDQTERYSGYAADIHASGHRLLSLIDDILDLSKIEAGGFELNKVNLDLGAQIRAAMRLVEARATEKSIGFAFEPEATLEMVADERALQQILVNLLTNAVKFTRAGGEVRVQMSRGLDGATDIAVEDTGIGIRSEDLSRVLQSFGQGRHDVAATNERGTGLGLPIVKGLVEAHGGTFRIESIVGVGTKAVLSFPPERAVENTNPLQAA